jgi:polyisoprenoid-binding protein YceI
MSATQQLIPPGVWVSDALHSSIRFEVGHMGVSTFSAGFVDVDARVLSSPDGLELRGRVGVASFDVHDDAMRPHVMAPDFLDVERYPDLTFRSTEIRVNGSDVGVTGELTIRGTTRRIEAIGSLTGPIVDPYGNDRIAMALETVIDRTEFGLDYQVSLPSGASALGNEVKLAVVLELVKER